VIEILITDGPNKLNQIIAKGMVDGFNFAGETIGGVRAKLVAFGIDKRRKFTVLIHGQDLHRMYEWMQSLPGFEPTSDVQIRLAKDHSGRYRIKIQGAEDLEGLYLDDWYIDQDVTYVHAGREARFISQAVRQGYQVHLE